MSKEQKISNPTLHDAGYRILSESQLHFIPKLTDYIQLTFKANRTITIDSIEYSVSKNDNNYPTHTAPNYFTVAVSQDADFKNFSDSYCVNRSTFLHDTTKPFIHDIDADLVLDDYLYVRIYPFDSGSKTGFFQLLNNSFILREGVTDVIQWDLSADYTSFTYIGADFSEATYGINGLISEGALSSGGQWTGCSDLTEIEIFDSRVNIGGDHSYQIASGQSLGLNYRVPSIIQEFYNGGGVKCIAANNEYLSSPAGDYFPILSSDLDIEVNYSNLGNVVSYPIGVRDGSTIFARFFLDKNNTWGFWFRGGVGFDDQISIDNTSTQLPDSGNIKIKGNGTLIEIYLDDVLIDSITSVITDYNILNSSELYFNSWYGTVSGIGDVDLSYIKINNHEWTFPEGTGSTTTNSQGVVTTLHSNIQEVSGVKCIADNNEYLSSPADDYFGSNINGLYIELDVSGINSASIPFLLSQRVDLNNAFDVTIYQNFLIIYTGDNTTGVFWDYGSIIPPDINIKLIGAVNSIEALMDDISFGVQAFTYDISLIQSADLYFNASISSGSFAVSSDAIFNSVKINDHEWTAPNWTAPTTTNSQGVVTTLHSDVSTSAMIQSSTYAEDMWLKEQARISALNNKTFNILKGDLWRVGQFYDTVETNFIANLPAYKPLEESYIQLFLTVANGSNIDIEDIHVEVAQNTNSDGERVHFYDLKWRVNDGAFTYGVQEKDISATSSSSPYDINDFVLNEHLEAGDIFEIRFYGYAADNTPTGSNGLWIRNGLTIFGQSKGVPATLVTVGASITFDNAIDYVGFIEGRDISYVGVVADGRFWDGFPALPSITFNVNPFEVNAGNQNLLYITIGYSKARLFINGSQVDEINHNIESYMQVKQRPGGLYIGSENSDVDISVSNHVIYGRELKEGEVRELHVKGPIFTSEQAVNSINILPLDRGAITYISQNSSDKYEYRANEFGFAYNMHRQNAVILDLNLTESFSGGDWNTINEGLIQWDTTKLIFSSGSITGFLLNAPHIADPMQVGNIYTLRIDWEANFKQQDTVIRIQNINNTSINLFEDFGSFDRVTQSFSYLFEGGVPLTQFRIFIGNPSSLKDDFIYIYHWEIIKGVEPQTAQLGSYEGLYSFSDFKTGGKLKEYYYSKSYGETTSGDENESSPCFIIDSTQLKLLGTNAEDNITYVFSIKSSLHDPSNFAETIYSCLSSGNQGYSVKYFGAGNNIGFVFQFTDLVAQGGPTHLDSILCVFEIKLDEEVKVVMKKDALTYKIWINGEEKTGDAIIQQQLVNGDSWVNNKPSLLMASNETALPKLQYHGACNLFSMFLTNPSDSDCLDMSELNSELIGIPDIKLDLSDYLNVPSNLGSTDALVSLYGYLSENGWKSGDYQFVNEFSRITQKIDMSTAGQSIKLPYDITGGVGNTWPTDITHINIVVSLGASVPLGLTDLFFVDESLSYTGYYVNGEVVSSVDDILTTQTGLFTIDLFMTSTTLTHFTVKSFTGSLARVFFSSFTLTDGVKLFEDRDSKKSFSGGFLSVIYDEYIKTTLSDYAGPKVLWFWDFNKWRYYNLSGFHRSNEQVTHRVNAAEYAVLPQYKFILD